MTNGDRAAWVAAYRVYDSFLPSIKTAAADHDTDTACQLLAEVRDVVAPVYDDADQGGKLLLIAVYGILEEIYADTRLNSA